MTVIDVRFRDSQWVWREKEGGGGSVALLAKSLTFSAIPWVLLVSLPVVGCQWMISRKMIDAFYVDH